MLRRQFSAVKVVSRVLPFLFTSSSTGLSTQGRAFSSSFSTYDPSAADGNQACLLTETIERKQRSYKKRASPAEVLKRRAAMRLSTTFLLQRHEEDTVSTAPVSLKTGLTPKCTSQNNDSPKREQRESKKSSLSTALIEDAEPTTTPSPKYSSATVNASSDYYSFSLKEAASYYLNSHVTYAAQLMKTRAISPALPQNRVCRHDYHCGRMNCRFVHPSRGEERLGDRLCKSDHDHKGIPSTCTCKYVHRSRGEKTLTGLEEERKKPTETTKNISNSESSSVSTQSTSSFELKGNAKRLSLNLETIASFYLEPQVFASERSAKMITLDPDLTQNKVCHFDARCTRGKRCAYVHPSRGQLRLGDRLCPTDDIVMQRGETSTCKCKYVHRSRGEKTLTELEEERKKPIEKTKEGDSAPSSSKTTENNNKVEEDTRKQQPLNSNEEQQPKHQVVRIAKRKSQLFRFDRESVYWLHAKYIRNAKLQAMDPSLPANTLCDCEDQQCEYVHPRRGETRVGDRICPSDQDSVRMKRQSKCPCKFVHRSRGEKTISELEKERSLEKMLSLQKEAIKEPDMFDDDSISQKIERFDKMSDMTVQEFLSMTIAGSSQETYMGYKRQVESTANSFDDYRSCHNWSVEGIKLFIQDGRTNKRSNGTLSSIVCAFKFHQMIKKDPITDQEDKEIREFLKARERQVPDTPNIVRRSRNPLQRHFTW